MELDGISASFEIIRSKRKTLAVQIEQSGNVKVRAPLRMSEREINKFLLSKKSWIERNVRDRQRQPAETLPKITDTELREMFEKAKVIIPERVRYYAPLVGVSYGRITVRNQKTRWGSCSGKGNLNFNCLLMMTPPEVLDAIVVHELCHRKQMNHSREFYAEVYRVYPEYDKWNSWLKKNGSALIRRAFDI